MVDTLVKGLIESEVMPDRKLTVKEAAKQVEVGEATIWRLIAKRRLTKYKRPGDRLRFNGQESRQRGNSRGKLENSACLRAKICHHRLHRSSFRGSMDQHLAHRGPESFGKPVPPGLGFFARKEVLLDIS